MPLSRHRTGAGRGNGARRLAFDTEERRMSTNRLACRLASVAVSLAFTLPAVAQTADPPARVGRLAAITGTVSYHLANADRWEAAALNLPLTSGAAVWTEPSARAAVDVGANRITLDSLTE